MTNTYDEHDNLNDAKRVCANESQCIGIFEGGCNKNGPFKLTKRGFMTSVSAANCIYKKNIYGMLIFLWSIIAEIKKNITTLLVVY